MSNKQVETVMTTKFTGDQRAVAVEAKTKKPDNPEEIIARNTTKEIDLGSKTNPKCGKNGCCQ